MDTLIQDLRFAVRSLRKAPGITALAVLCLAIGIGLNTTVFSIIDAALLKPMGFKDPERLVVVQDVHIKDGDKGRSGLSYKNLIDVQQGQHSFSEMAAQSARSVTLTDGDEPERILAGTISSNLFPMLGVRPILGRVFRPDEDQPGAPPVILLSHEVWQRRYKGDPNIVGRALPVSGVMTTVVGVMPPKFKFPQDELLWIPVVPDVYKHARAERGLAVFARLAPNVTAERASAEMKSLAAQLAAEYPDDNRGWSTTVRSLRKEFMPADVTLVLWAMMGAVVCVLLIACANVANLMLARAASRHREIAIRSAIGAGRGRIVRQLLTESVLIALVGAGFGILIAFWGLDLFTAAMPHSDGPPYWIQWKIDERALLFTAVVAVVTGILFGLAPALQASKGNLQDALKEGARGTGAGGRRGGLRNVLVVTEVALSLVLLVTAALFVRSFMALQYVDPGFDVSKLMSMRLYLPGTPYDSDIVKRQRLEDVVRRIEALPGVEAAVASNTIPIGDGGGGDGIIAEGSAAAPGEEPIMNYTGVTAHWFRTVGVPVARGRDFTEAEGSDSAAVAIVNSGFAKQLWKDQDPLGRRFRLRSDPGKHWFTVIGVARDFKVSDIDNKEPERWAYLPYLWLPVRNNGITIRVAGNPADITNAGRKAIHAADRGLPVFDIDTVERLRQRSFWQYGLFGTMFSVFGGIALLLALVGVYGVISYGVEQRTHEIGVRMALGARSEDVLKMIVGQGARLAGVGIGIGLAIAFGAAFAIRSVLWNTSPVDPVSFVGIAALLTGTAMLASWLPARRAAAVDPMVALREE